MNAIDTKVSTLSVETLKEMAIALSADTREEVDTVLNAVLSALERSMPEAEFVTFCDAI